MTRRDQEPRKGRFNNTDEEMLYRLSLHGWANASSGEVDAITGFFARIAISAAELPEIVEAFEEDIAEVGVTSTAGLIGFWLLREHSDGFVTVEECDSEPDLIQAYEALERDYGSWLGDES